MELQAELFFIWSSLNELTKLFIYIVSGVGGYFLLLASARNSASFGPPILLSLGIFGTFLGIAVGLSKFDSSNIEQSIPLLLDGLKTSFWSSIAGLFFSLLIKFRQVLFSGGSSQATGATIDDLVEHLAALRNSLAGTDEDTVINQMKLSRLETKDELRGIRKELSQFLEEFADSSSEKLIEALEAVIKDFNAKINEQFGENFKQLNEAVGRLLEWQDNYRTQLDELITVQTRSSKDLDLAAASFTTSVEQSSKFNEVATSMGQLLGSLATERQRIQEMTASLASSLDACKTSIPSMEAKVLGLTDVLTQTTTQVAETSVRAINTASEQLNANLEKAAGNTDRQVAELDRALSEQLSASLEMLGRQLSSLSEKFVADYSPLTDKLRQVVRIADGAR